MARGMGAERADSASRGVCRANATMPTAAATVATATKSVMRLPVKAENVAAAAAFARGTAVRSGMTQLS